MTHGSGTSPFLCSCVRQDSQTQAVHWPQTWVWDLHHPIMQTFDMHCQAGRFKTCQVPGRVPSNTKQFCGLFFFQCFVFAVRFLLCFLLSNSFVSLVLCWNSHLALAGLVFLSSVASCCYKIRLQNLLSVSWPQLNPAGCQQTTFPNQSYNPLQQYCFLTHRESIPVLIFSHNICLRFQKSVKSLLLLQNLFVNAWRVCGLL